MVEITAQIAAWRACFVMLLVSIPLMAIAAASRSATIVYAVAVTTVIQMVAIGLTGIVVGTRKSLAT
jgi:hypothetical protein